MPSRFRLLALAALLLLLPLSAVAQSSPWTVEDVLKQASISDVAIHPDGNRILWTKRYPDLEADRYKRDIYLTYRTNPHGGDEPATVRLTRSGDNRDPVWSPDGQHIAFLSSRDHPASDDASGAQVWLLDPRGGAPAPLTALENGVRDLAWLDDEHVLFSARERDTQHEDALEEAQDHTRVVEDTTLYHPVRLFTAQVASQSIERVSDNTFPITEFAADPTGHFVVYAVDPSPVDADARNQPRQYLLDLDSGTRTEIFAEQYFDPSDFQWTLDGSGFYARDAYASDPEHEGAGISLLYYYDRTARSYQEVDLNAGDRGIGAGGYAVTQDGIHVQIANGPRMTPRFYQRQGDGWTHTPVADERFHHATSIAVGPDGETVVFDYSRPDRLPTYHVGTYDDGTVRDVEEWVEINQYLDERPMPRAEVIEWTGAEGRTVNGILYYPLDYDPSRQYPLVTAIHGGPSGVDLDVWRLSWTVFPGLWAQRGAFVFRPNYHGSGHHGLEFVESIKGRYYELEIPDIVNGVEHLVDQGLVDRDSLGVMGWSNGAILAIQLTVEHPDLFRVSAPGAGDVNWISDYGNCAFGVRFDDSYFRGPPWEHLDHYIEKSPLFELDQVRTPTLIHHGEEDRAVPTQQGWEFYRAMQQMGHAPVRFLLYPGEPHGLREISHQRRKMEEDLKWFDTYLFGTTSMQERVAERPIPDDAPLAYLARRSAIAETNGRYGVMTNGVLVPEMAEFGDSLMVSRFEITRAQYQAFQSGYAVDPTTTNLPANGLSAENAEAYVAWLREQTGRDVRLPTAHEMKRLRQAAGSAENNLTHWIGHTPTPDEMPRIQAHLDAHAPDDVLMPVGNRPPGHADGDRAPLLFDLDGNVAEWARTDDGTLRPMNSSAVTFHDPQAAVQSPPPAAFVGLRVVMDAE
jgi:dipeptidyl aminopeptidase/acylaminoacyl peptidase